jgi:hypothetical protein
LVVKREGSQIPSSYALQSGGGIIFGGGTVMAPPGDKSLVVNGLFEKYHVGALP